jgi:hypothetical protein
MCEPNPQEVHTPPFIFQKEAMYERGKKNYEIVIQSRVVWNFLGPTVEGSKRILREFKRFSTGM